MLRNKLLKIAAGALCALAVIGCAPVVTQAITLQKDTMESSSYNIQVDDNASVMVCTGQIQGISGSISDGMGNDTAVSTEELLPYLYWKGTGDTVYDKTGTVPTEAGTYTVSLVKNAMKLEDSVGTPYNVTAYTHQSSGETYTEAGCASTAVLSADGKSLQVACANCGYVYENGPTISIKMNEDNVIGLEAGETSCWEIVTSDNWSGFFTDASYEPEIVTIYEGVGTTKYNISTTLPETSGTYTVSLTTKAAYETGKKATINKVRTTKQKFSIVTHRYIYKQNGFGITAQCTSCDNHASVSIDTEYIYDQARNYGTYDSSKQVYEEDANYELVSEDGWSDLPDILPYTVLYNGKHTVSSTETVAYNKVFEELKPTTTGNYTAQLAVLTDENDPDSAIVTSTARPFYLADINLKKCTLKEYGSTEISQFKEPELVNGYYQVGTLSELLWCVYNKNTDANISLTNDIVVNPIRVTETGTITSATYSLYNWKGFGASDAYTGTIKGNGFTIYGIYHPNAASGCNQCSGLIDHGVSCSVYDLTVENSYIKEGNAASIVGYYEASKRAGLKISNCHSVNCCISSVTDDSSVKDPGGTAGGIVGYLQVYEAVVPDGFSIVNCTSDSIVKNSYNAGGIVGAFKSMALFTMKNCINYGNIQSPTASGGIFGTLCPEGKPQNVSITNCINAGQIDGDKCCGGIVGRVSDNTNYTVTDYDPDSPSNWRKIKIEKCISQGHISDTSQYSAGIIGYYDSLLVYVNNNSYSDAGCACEAGSKVTGTYDPEARSYEIPNSKSKTYACEQYGHVVSNHWSNVQLATCTQDGSMSHVCKLCGKVIDTQILAAHGHVYEDEVCIYCGESETTDEDSEESEELEGTITSTTSTSSSGGNMTPIVIGGVVALLAIGAGGYVVVRKKKSNHKKI